MTVDEFLEELRLIPGVTLHPPAEERDMAALEQRYGIRLPALHRELLLRTNGIEAADGYLRLFGVGPGAAIDMGGWNEPQLWKFACEPWISEYLCIGETGWGNQFTLRLNDLASAQPDPLLYYFSVEMQVLREAVSIVSYLCGGFLSEAQSPSRRGLRKKLGSLPPSEHVIYSPPPLISGEEKVKHAMKMPAVMAMILNADVRREYTRISRGLTYFDFTMVAMEPYVDDQGRPRMRLVSDDDVRATGR